MKKFAEIDPRDFFGKQEELNPELAPYLQETSGIGQVLQHPLIYSVPHHPVMNGMVNQQYLKRKEMLAEALESANWGLFVSLHEKPYRLEALQYLYDNYNLTPQEYYDLLGDVYRAIENTNQYQDDFQEIFYPEEYSPQDTRHMMGPEDQAMFDSLPETLTIYRGTEFNEEGWSWTLDKQKAIWFAKRFQADTPVVLTGTVNKEYVIAYLGGRGESEIVVNPDLVKVTNKEVVK